MTDDRQRIDKWLWFARVVKTRDLAKALAESGHVRLNSRKIDAASQAVKIGDVLTIGIYDRVRILRVVGFAERRQGAPEASLTYKDLSPVIEPTSADDDDPAPPQSHAPQAVRGEGRLTKRDRRRFDRESGEFG